MDNLHKETYSGKLMLKVDCLSLHDDRNTFCSYHKTDLIYIPVKYIMSVVASVSINIFLTFA